MRFTLLHRIFANRRFSAFCLGLLAGAASLLLPSALFAQEEQTGVCAPVKIVISQQLTLERVGFLATLQVTDNDGQNPITGFSASLTFQNPALSTNGTVNDSSSMFFVQPPQLQNISAVDGTGVIGPGSTATISWFIIPTVTAGGTTPNGVLYQVGANLGGMFKGVTIPASSMQAVPAPITVQPDAQLQITYFQPRDVTGANPFSGEIQSPIPFAFGVLVQNVGYGTANSLQIQSQQPQIVQNVQNLPLVAQLLGSSVNGAPMSNADLTVNFGTLNPGQTVEGAWDMICTFSGTFTSVSASYTHSTALGGQETSLIKSVNAYLYLHQVLDDSPGKDTIPDFLADTSGTLDPLLNMIPDSLYESQGNVLPVNMLTNVTVVNPDSNPFQVNLNANISGWSYMRVTDPGQAKLPIASVVRSDGKVLNGSNYWTSIHYDPGSNYKETYLNLFDLVGLGQYSYTVTYTNLPPNTNPPVTTIHFVGNVTYTNGVYFVPALTQVYFLSQDPDPVDIFYSLNNGEFLPAIPFYLITPGVYTIQYYGLDTDQNQESNETSIVEVAGADTLGFASNSISSTPIYNPGGALSIRPGLAPISFSALPNPTALNAEVDIFQGVVGWVTISNVPSSPTASTSAELAIGGGNVDYYKYQLNGGAWSADQPVSSPLALSGLSSGSNFVAVLGRSQYGAYMDATNADVVGWIVDPAAPATIVTGSPATPALSDSGQLTVGGAGVTDYRWTLNNNFYQVSTPVANPIVLSNLVDGPQLVSVLGGTNGVDQPTNVPSSVSWTLNPLYGYDLSSLPLVRTVLYSNVSGQVTYNWNGESDAGVVQSPGWYTVRISLIDSLGHTNFVTGLVEIDPLSGTNDVLAGFNRGPQNPYARGRWAVWQDQSDGNWEIYAQDVTSNSPIQKLTSTPLSQENPRTDGRYVVWQALQTNGSWDIYMNDMDGTNGPQAVTSTPGIDEVNPSIDWPWVVYQSRASGNTNAPWLIYALNLSNMQSIGVSPSTQNELTPDVQAGRVVWADYRDQGAGEIYYYDLEKNYQWRVTTNIYSQINPAIDGNWIVWEDNRNIELDIYGWDISHGKEVQITDTPEDETQPYLNGQWVLCMENSLGPQTGNGRLINLASLATVPVTRTPTLKSYPALADGYAVWLETVTNQSEIVAAQLPSLQAVFQNRNIVAVTPSMVSYAQNAYNLLGLWAGSGVQSITEYISLAPVTSQTASLNGGTPSGVNFNLVAGTYLWVKFNNAQVLDLGVNNSSTLNFVPGANVFGYTAFPDSYSAYKLLSQLGVTNAVAVRMLDSQSGLWRVAEVRNGSLAGDNFHIPNVAVLTLNMTNAVNQFTPRSP
jgi:beta propeller repeat protein